MTPEDKLRALELAMRVTGCDLDRALLMAERIMEWVEPVPPPPVDPAAYPIVMTPDGALTQFDQGWNSALQLAINQIKHYGSRPFPIKKIYALTRELTSSLEAGMRKGLPL